MILSGMAGGVAGPVLTSWIMSLKWLVFKRTKIGFWREVVKATETYVSPPLDEYERPGDVPIIKVNRIVANPSTLKTQLVSRRQATNSIRAIRLNKDSYLNGGHQFYLFLFN